MAQIYYQINSGYPNFTAHIEPNVAPDQIHSSTGIYSFDDIPAGNYSITITDAIGCEAFFDNISITTTTTSTTTSTSTTTTTTTIGLNNSSILFVDNSTPSKIYLYNPDDNSSTLLSIPNVVDSNVDIAHTSTKLWLNHGTQEWNIVSSPFSAVFNRTIFNSASTSTGLCAKDDVTLIEMNGALVIESDITTNIAVNTNKFVAQGSRVVAGDFMLTTNNKFIVTTRNASFTQYWISQYNYTTGTLELDLDITSVAPAIYGIYEHGGEIYLAQSGGNIYHIMNTYPYTITFVNTASHPINGASQVPQYLTTYFITTTTTTTTAP